MNSPGVKDRERGCRNRLDGARRGACVRGGSSRSARVLSLLESLPGRWFSGGEIVRRVPTTTLGSVILKCRRALSPGEEIVCHQVVRPGTRDTVAHYAYIKDRRVWALPAEIVAMRRYHDLPEVPDYLADYDVHEPTAEERAAAQDVLAGLTHGERFIEAQRQEEQDHAERVSAAGAEHPGLLPGEALDVQEAEQIREHQEQRRAEAAAVLKSPATLQREQQARRIATHPPDELPGQIHLFSPPAEHERRAGA